MYSLPGKYFSYKQKNVYKTVLSIAVVVFS